MESFGSTNPGATFALLSGQSVQQPSKTDKLSQAKATAEQFEAVFLSQMLTHMFSGIKVDKMFGGGQAEETYRTLMVQEYGKILAKAGGVGIADAVLKEILTLQEVGK